MQKVDDEKIKLYKNVIFHLTKSTTRPSTLEMVVLLLEKVAYNTQFAYAAHHQKVVLPKAKQPSHWLSLKCVIIVANYTAGHFLKFNVFALENCAS